jgi:hypothetical protein
MHGQGSACGQSLAGTTTWCEILYNVSSTTQAPITILPPTGYSAQSGDFYLSQANGVQLYYFGVASASQSNVLFWNQATNQSTVVASIPALGNGIQTDGTLVVWASGSTPPATLAALNVATAAQQTLSNAVYSQCCGTLFYEVANGLAAWVESASNSGAIKAFDGSNTTTLSTKTSSYLFGTGGGYVLFEEDAKMYAWNAATQTRQLLFEAAPGQALI